MIDRLDAALVPWTKRTADLIVRRVADARAHAESGRVSAAHARLDELRDGLIGATPGDTTGLLRDARAAFYASAFDEHGPFDSEIHQPIKPVPEDADWIRTTPILDADWHRLEAVMAEARTHLSQSAASTIARSDVLAGWEARHRDRITGTARAILSDSQMAIHNVVGRLLVKPELR